MAIRRSLDAASSAPPKIALPTMNTISSPIAKKAPIQIGFPGSASYALEVQDIVYDLAKLCFLYPGLKAPPYARR